MASVFYNRLNNFGDPNYGFLQSDATTAYELGHDPTPEDIKNPTPFNTYTNTGLPPTPICSPGLDCLQAVCNPAQTNYFFFYFAPDEKRYDAVLLQRNVRRASADVLLGR